MPFSTFDKSIGTILKHEGGLADNPNDPGGLTNFGISWKFAKSELQKDGDNDGFSDSDFDKDGDFDRDDILNMKVGDAIRIYKQYWWDKFHYELLTDQDVATKIFDCAVNMGAPRSHVLAQQACNVLMQTINTPLEKLLVDGQLGSKSFNAINSFPPQEFLKEMCKQQKAFYDLIITKNSKLEVFRKNWYHRSKWPFKEMPA